MQHMLSAPPGQSCALTPTGSVHSCMRAYAPSEQTLLILCGSLLTFTLLLYPFY